MTDTIPVLQDEDNERPVPTAWRRTLIDIVQSFKEGDFRLERGIDGVQSVSVQEANRLSGNIAAYGDQLASLPEATWRTSIYRWMRGYWDVLIDLYTVREGSSDLVLFVRVYEKNGKYSFEVQSINVP